MTRKVYYWDLRDFSVGNSLERYCHNCGCKVIFTDSKLRRRNANGKTIYEYAIYKCVHGHTWNKPMGIYKSDQNPEFPETRENFTSVTKKQVSVMETISLEELQNEGIYEIEILLEEVIGRWRIDKLLGERIQGISRGKVCKLIRLGRVLIDGKAVKQDYVVKKHQKIGIILNVEVDKR
jgi:hypothetical protein